MRILWLTIPVGIALGTVEVIFQQNVTGIDANVFSLWIFLATLVVVLTLAPRARVASDTEPSWKLSGRAKQLPERVRSVWTMQQLPRIGMLAALGVFAIILGILGFVIQYAAWTVGFGALLLTRFGTRYGWGEAAGPESPAPAAPVTHGPEGMLAGGYDEPGAPSPSGF
jgi:hypothetical protein